MPTAYELVDTAIKVLGGAFVTAAASYVITRNQHRHSERQSELVARRAILERVASELAAYYAAPTTAQHVLSLHARGRVGEDSLHAMLEQLIRAMTGWRPLSTLRLWSAIKISWTHCPNTGIPPLRYTLNYGTKHA